MDQPKEPPKKKVTPEQFIRERLRLDYGEDVARVFDKALAAGLPCERCGKGGDDVDFYALEPRLGGKALAGLYEAVRRALPEGEHHKTVSIVPATGPLALCGACAKIISESAPEPGLDLNQRWR